MRFKRFDGGGLFGTVQTYIWLIFQHHYRSFVITWPHDPQSIIFFKLLGRSPPLIGLPALLNLLYVLELVQQNK